MIPTRHAVARPARTVGEVYELRHAVTRENSHAPCHVKRYAAASDVPGTRSCLLRTRITFNRPDRENSNRSGWLATWAGGERAAVTIARVGKHLLGGGLPE